MRGCRDQIRIVSCLFTIRQQCNVFQACSYAMPSLECSSVDRPTRDAFPVMNLLERNPGGEYDVFHAGGMLKGRGRIGVKWFDQDAPTAACQSGADEGLRILDAEQSGLDADSPRQQ